MPVFFDTNILVYCTDLTNPAKQAIARQTVVQASLRGDAWVSTQVLIELFNVLIRRQHIPAPAAMGLVSSYTAWPVVDSDLGLVTSAMELSTQQQLSIWDAMVVVAAQRAGAQTLYTEDLNHGQLFGTVRVVNPFATSA